MANLTDSSALSALNEKDYINKLYDSNTDTTKKLLQENYTQNNGLLDSEKQSVADQTQTNIDRTNVEAKQSQNAYTGPKQTLGASAQESLSRGNALQKNTTSLNQKQVEADAEIERQRQLLGSQYAAAIKKAQADNDMERAQQLYDAAKDEEEKLLALRTTASSLLAEKGDTSIRDALLNGETPSPDYSGETWEQVLKNESSINDIYDNQLKSKLLALQMEQEEAASGLAAKRSKQSAETDSKLTEAYVDALQKAKNYAEVQNAYGQGSGTAAAARVAQDTEMQDELTRLRGVQTAADAGYGIDNFELLKKYLGSVADNTQSVNSDRAKALLEAAEKEEENLYNTQLTIGQEMAKNNDYSVLGKLYGLTDDQIDRLQGTGAYAPVYYEEPASSGWTLNKALSNYYGTTTTTGTDKSMTASQVSDLYDRLNAAAQQDRVAAAEAAQKANLVALAKQQAQKQSKSNSSTTKTTSKTKTRI